MQTAVVKQSWPSVESLQKKKQNVPDAQRAKKPIWRVVILILHQSMDNSVMFKSLTQEGWVPGQVSVSCKH